MLKSLYDSRKKKLLGLREITVLFVTKHFRMRLFVRDSLEILSLSLSHIHSLVDFLLISRREDHPGKLVLGHPLSLSSSCERDRYAKQPGVITVRRSSTILKLLAAPLFYRRRGQRGFSQPILILPINLPCPFDWNFTSFEEIVRTFCLASRRCSSARPLDRPGSCNYPIRGRARGR